MISAAWFLYCTAVSLLLHLAGIAGEAALRAAGRSVRWVWVAAVAGTFVLPLAAWSGVMRRVFPARIAGPAQESTLIEVATGSVIGDVALLEAAADHAAGGLQAVIDRMLTAATPAFSVVWLVLSVLLTGAVLLAGARLRRLRAGWRGEVIDGVPVLVSRRVGPAVVGLVSGSIVVPQWALALEQRLRRLMLLHEREHLRAGDLLLSVFGLAALILMPWNVPLWWQVRRLRAAVELDCDARVLRTVPDPRGYGTLLLEVGRRHSGLGPLAIGLGEPPTTLERRIRMLTGQGVRPRLRTALMLGLVAGIIALGSCWVDHPSAPLPATQQSGQASAANDAGEAAVTQGSADAQQMAAAVTVQPRLLNPRDVLRALEEAYPALLRAAETDSRGVYRILVDETGMPERSEVAESSGYEEFDAAVAEIISIMRFSPLMNGDEPVATWVEMPITYQPPRAKRDRTSARADDSRPEASADARSAESSAPSPPVSEIVGTVPPKLLTAAPRLLNARDVLLALDEAYPPHLKDAGIGGGGVYRILIDETGTPQGYEVQMSSGVEPLDAAVDRVWRRMRFSSPMNGDEPVATWAEMPITFKPPRATPPPTPPAEAPAASDTTSDPLPTSRTAPPRLLN